MKLFAEKDPFEELKAKLDDYNEKLSEMKAGVDAAENQIKSAQDAMEAAAEANDAAAFEKAKEALVKAETGLEMAKMRLDKLTERGPATQQEISDAISRYEDEHAAVNCKACKEILDRLNALNKAIEDYEAEARQILKKEKEICDLFGIPFTPVNGNLSAGSSVIYASAFKKRWPSNEQLKMSGDLQRFASKA